MSVFVITNSNMRAEVSGFKLIQENLCVASHVTMCIMSVSLSAGYEKCGLLVNIMRELVVVSV